MVLTEPEKTPDIEMLRKAAGIKKGETLWVFGYGSLIWLPCFNYVQALAGNVSGYHRAFCLYSHKYRGTPEKPGLVLGLDRGGFVQGVAFEIPAPDVDEALENLWQREMGVEDFYKAISVPVRILGQEEEKPVNALTFVVSDNNPKHCPQLTVDQQADIIATASGMTGSNAEYLEKTVMGLQRIGILDPLMEDLLLGVRTRKLLEKTSATAS